METLVAHTEMELEDVAKRLLLVCEKNAREGGVTGADVIALSGDLGAGKTAFTKALARVFHLTDTVTSPTFVIMKSYALSGYPRYDTLMHIDAYRIEDEVELTVLGFKKWIETPRTLVVIEWPERVPSLIPEQALSVHIEIGEDNERIFSYGG
jgi:tRNA threonylcarbamoyladenosine biosynthesis protein TsaE